jgi:hypothetical protein
MGLPDCRFAGEQQNARVSRDEGCHSGVSVPWKAFAKMCRKVSSVQRLRLSFLLNTQDLPGSSTLARRLLLDGP